MDAGARRALLGDLAEFAGAGGAVLLTTQQLAEAEAIATRVVLLIARTQRARGNGGPGPGTRRAREGDLPRSGSPPLDGIASVDSRGDRHVVYVDDADAFVAELVRSGVAFRALEVMPVSLEDAFVSLTGAARVRLALAHARAETANLARYPAYALPTVAFPAILLLVFGRSSSGASPTGCSRDSPRQRCSPSRSSSSASASRRAGRRPWETYLRTLPAAPTTRLAGRVLSALVFAAATVSAVALVAFTVYRVEMAPWRFGALGLALLVGSIPFALLGIAFGYWLPPRAALPVANILYLPLAVGGFLWMRPTEDVPHDVDVASQLLPTRSWMEVLDPIATGDHAIPLHHVAALTAWGLVFFALAWWGYRRDEGERFT